MEFSREYAHSAFEREALRRPDALAVVCGDARTTYGALDHGADRLARHLRAHGVGPDVLVAICMSRSPRLIESVLAVLKAGGAYVPLDPAYPPDRLAFMLADARPTVVLTDAACRPLLEGLLVERMPAATDVVPVVIDCDAWSTSPGDAQALEDTGLRPEHLAYVIYTSGSTGRPKGVMVTHRGLPNLQRVQGELFEVSPDSRVLQFASFSFDACVFEWSMALSHGASLHLGAPGEVLAGEVLATLVAREGITHATLPPIVLSGLADDALATVRVLICAGEALPPAQVKRWARASGTTPGAAPRRRMFNAYGPTETTIWSSVHACDPQSQATSVPIGRAIDGHCIHLFDSDGRPASAGETGEIHIGGIGVARGYLHRPELTAERFIDSPFVPGDRLYRTGDLARELADGTLEYLGRNDFQVKVRGHRIELGEIEAALAARADIREVVVVARDDEQGRKQLVAYYELHDGGLHHGVHRDGVEACPVDALRAQLAETLPAFMVPAAYVRMTAWPLTPNGKLDRKALPAPEAEAFAATEFVAPQGDTETALAAIWSELLGIERIGRDDAFLTLGGDSLKTIQLAPRIRERLGRRVAVPELFRAPTLRAMAAAIDAHEVETGSSAARADDADAAGASFDEWRPQEAMPERCPLSYQQHGLWLLEQLTDTSLAYNAQNVIRVRGRLDPVLLQRAVDAVIARHEIFRTSFHSDGHADSDGEPYQTVHPRADGVLRHEMLPPGTSDAELSARIDTHVAHRFDLARLPLVHLTLLERSAGGLVPIDSAPIDSVLIHVEQHYVHDGWSANLFLRELLAAYVAYAEGREPALPPVVAQYRDYARWQRSDDAERRNAAHVAYWTRQLDGAPFNLPMPTDFPRPALPTYRGEQLRFECTPELSSRLRRFCEAEGVTLYAALQAVFQIVLKIHTGSDDFLVGSAVANRRAHRSEGMLGMFVNTIAVRACVAGDPSYRTLLAQTMETLSAGYEHEEVPFERVVRALQPEREIGRNPLFQVAFSAHNSDVPTLHGPGFELNLYEAYSNRTSKFDFDVVMIPRGFEHADSVTLLWTYAQDLYRRETIQRLRDSYLRVLDQCLAAPDAPLSAIDALSPEERASALDGDCTVADYDLDRPAHAWFERHAARAPRALAASCEGDAIEYGELNARANRLAHALRERGIGPDRLVGICMQRSISWIVSVLAVLKAGGAYVPMDPGYPGERLRDMLIDAEPSLVLTDAHGAGVLAAAMATPDAAAMPGRTLLERMIEIDADGAQWAAWPADDIAPEQIGLAPSHPAYVIYTSGSTGRPKGVLVPHRGAANLLQVQAGLFEVSPASRVLQFASFSFDACVFEWLMALSHGASLHMPAPGVVLIGDALESFVAQVGITHALLPPVVLSALSDTATLPGLHVLISGGEAMPPALVRRWAPGRALFNAYGPTEDSVVSTVHRCDPVADTGATVPIGRGLPNHRTYVLDAHRRPLPTGVPGELYVGGVGVALGYLNRPALTAERFIDNPFIAGERLYRTGDVVRRRADGALEYLGRNDFQVKIRGYRIELGEIESKLAALPEVKEAVVLARQDIAGQPARLVAYYQCARTGEATADTLRTALHDALPEYMVPAAYVEVSEWPLTVNGKLDRKALPAPDAEAYAGRAAYEAPATPMETTMADIWAELLGVERVGRHDHFFALGGHSLLGVRLVMRVRKQMGLEIAPNALFASPTLAAYSAHADVRHAAGQQRAVPLETIPRAARGDTLASYAQQRLWFLSRMGGSIDAHRIDAHRIDAHHIDAYHIARAVELRGDLDQAALQWSLDRLVARHESLRTTFEMVEGALYQRIGAPTAFALEVHDLSELETTAQAATLRSLQRDEAGAPFDLERGPLLRGRLIRLEAARHVLLLTMHHIVSDGWSMAVFSRELEALYASRRAGGGDPLPALEVQYADYAAWQRQRLQGERLAREGDYWRAALHGAPSLLTLPTDRKHPPEQDYRGALLDVTLDAALTQRLKALGLKHGATLYMTLLAAWSVVLSRLSGQTDVVVGTPVANRGHSEVEGMIGFFVNTLPVRVTLEDVPTVSDLIGQVKSRVLEAQAHQDLPFEQVVEMVNPVRSLGHTPIFQAMFAWQNNASEELRFDGLEARSLRMPHAVSKFDLTLGLGETEDGGIAGEIEYATALFDEATIARHAGYLRQVLSGMTTAGQADGSAALSQLALLPPEAIGELVDGGLRPEPHNLGRPLHAWFEDRAAQAPEAPALACDAERFTFGELNADANRLARVLRAAGVVPDAMVGICMANGSGAILSVLAVLKSGGAYVPLDPEYPAERIEYMLQDAKPAVVLTDAAGRPLLARILAAMPVEARPQVIDLQADAECWRSQPAENLESNGVTPQHLAYVIYTSGSTGRPKGVMIEHRSAANLWHESRRQVLPGERRRRVGLNASLSFDASVQSWLQLLSGHCVVVIPQNVRKDPVLLASYLRAHRVEAFDCTPMQLEWLHPQMNAEDTARTEAILVGGEAINPVQWRAWAAWESVRLYNAYGPTECTVDSTVALIVGDAPFLGHPIANVRAYVLDEGCRLVPPGVVGELYLGGAGLARGYLNRPELTAERFVDNPFVAGERLYRTGDLASRRVDGVLEYLGRNDFQVKIRGYRIELGEIESKLVALPGVKDAVVLAREDAPEQGASAQGVPGQGVPGQKRLVAYYLPDEAVPDKATAADAEGLRAQLKAQLPDYMVPTAYVRLEAWPLTSNGKLDRKALPAPDGDACVGRTAYAAPRTPMEEAMAGIWSQVLGVERVGVHDNFFDLGGHSLMAMRLIMAVQDMLGVDVSLRDLFEGPTIEQMLAVIFAQTEEDVLDPA